MDETNTEAAHGPQLLPGGRAVLFTIGTRGVSWDQARLVVQSLDTGERKVLVEGGRDARYVSTGHLLYAQRGTLLAVPFDLDRLDVIAGPVAVVEDVRDAGVQTGAAQLSVSTDGTLVYVPGAAGGTPERTLVWVDRQGREEPLAARPRPYSWVRISPDGTRLAIEVQEENTDVWIHDVVRNTQSRLTFGPEADRFPFWTPDGRRIVWSSGSELVWKPADGTGQVERLATSESPLFPSAWSRDGAPWW